MASVTATDPLPIATHRLFILNAVDELITRLEQTDGSITPASKASIDALPAVELTEECSICLDDRHEEKEDGREMPCKHKFHSNCIEKWLKMNGNCPICRYRMPEEEKSSADDDKSSVGSDREVRARVTILFVSASRFGIHEAVDSEEDMNSDLNI